MKKLTIVLLSSLFLSGGVMPLYSQDEGNDVSVRDEGTLNYTYVGPFISAGYMSATYTDWFETETREKTVSGMYYSGGAAMMIFAGEFCGDFKINYVYNQLDYSLAFAELSISGKYFYSFNNMFSAGGGLGLYFATPLSNKEYNGSGGIMLPVSAVFNTTSSTKLFFDIYFGYGSFGIGEDTSSFRVGINAGFIFKVGRI